MSASDQDVRRELDHVFRKSWGQMVAALTRILGTARIDQAEALVQEAFVAALKAWAFQGIPDSPVGWLIMTAKNRALDQLKHERVQTVKQDGVRAQLESWAENAAEAGTSAGRVVYSSEVEDDLLRMMYVCCFPELNAESQVALIMKNLCGLSVREIARGFLQKEKTVEQRLTRAKNFIRERKPPFELPEPASIAARTDVVLDALYFLFNEGYAATEGELLIRRDLCGEAIRLLDLVLAQPLASSPAGHALQSLFCLQSSRFDARFDDAGDVILFEDQDRTLWNLDLLAKGLMHLNQAMAADELSVFHLEAGIAAEYATASSFSATNWPAVIRYYDALLVIKKSPVVALNRAVAIALSDRPDGLAALYELERDAALKDYHLLYASIGELERRRGKNDVARTYLNKALALARTDPERRFLANRLSTVR